MDLEGAVKQRGAICRFLYLGLGEFFEFNNQLDFAAVLFLCAVIGVPNYGSDPSEHARLRLR